MSMDTRVRGGARRIAVAALGGAVALGGAWPGVAEAGVR
jgi:hypothetical protein